MAKKIEVIKIDRDYIAVEGISSRVGCTWEASADDSRDDWAANPIAEGDKVRFRLLDDDGEVYYGGWLLNDDDCLNQQVALAWAMRDAGCTEVQIKKDEEWVTEIG